ncbi:MAG: IS3 family transposase [Candidatus Methanomethylicaceae archaeon]
MRRYLVRYKDLFNGEIVGYAMDSRMTQELVKRSLLMAVNKRKPQPGLIHHSDRGSQYCANNYQNMLKLLNIIPSMSRKGNPYDNALLWKSFFGTLKNELIYHKRYATRKEAIKDIIEYIEIFYNRQRLQERLGYLSPVEFLKEFYAMRMAT